MTTAIQKLSLSAMLAYSSVAYGGWEQLAPIPDRLGVAAPFAGVCGEMLLVAGGANFPEKAPWEGGKKVWYDTVYALDAKAGSWTNAGRLPRALAYGVSVTFQNRMLCIGGSDATQCYADVFELRWENGKGKVVTGNLPALPVALSNACGACVGSVVYVAGGQTSNDSVRAETAVFAIELADANPAWKSIAPMPGSGRILATAASFHGGFYVIGGCSLSEGKDHLPQREYLADGYCYKPGTGWTRIANLPNPIVAAPSPAPTDESGIYILGGDDGSHVGFKPVNLHPGFSKSVLHYDQRAGTWGTAGEMSAARVTVPCAQWKDGWVITSGEMRPGVRSPQVWMFKPGTQP